MKDVMEQHFSLQRKVLRTPSSDRVKFRAEIEAFCRELRSESLRMSVDDRGFAAESLAFWISVYREATGLELNISLPYPHRQGKSERAQVVAPTINRIVEPQPPGEDSPVFSVFSILPSSEKRPRRLHYGLAQGPVSPRHLSRKFQNNYWGSDDLASSLFSVARLDESLWSAVAGGVDPSDLVLRRAGCAGLDTDGYSRQLRADPLAFDLWPLETARNPVLPSMHRYSPDAVEFLTAFGSYEGGKGPFRCTHAVLLGGPSRYAKVEASLPDVDWLTGSFVSDFTPIPWFNAPVNVNAERRHAAIKETTPYFDLFKSMPVSAESEVPYARAI